MSMIRKLIRMLQQTNLYKKQVLFRCKRNYTWVKNHYTRKAYNNEEISEIVNYIEESGITDYARQFYYSFCDEYNDVINDIFFDEDNGLFYACGKETKNKRLYFAKSINTKQKAYEFYRQMCVEQNCNSPHCYLSSSFRLNQDNILLDIGAADGNFSLSVVDDVKKIYLFECSGEWIEALTLTFAPYKDKIEIVEKYVSNCDKENYISLDNFFRDKEDRNLAIKMDIEGAEIKALKGAKGLFNTGRIKKMAICAYHRQNDEKNILRFLSDYNYNVEYAHGYIMKMADFFSRKPFYRRGVLRITLE